MNVNDVTTDAPKCDENPAGPGGILCPGCLTVISAQTLPAP